jgi:MarR family 2-MHQ and catechol resistance regulon transcriptional repressor
LVLIRTIISAVITSRLLMRSPKFLPLLRELSRTYQAFEVYSSAHVRLTGLTPPQFDIIATLGNTAGMTSRELGEKTLITKGTLTGVVDRLVEKKLVRRSAFPGDGRCQIIQLTAQGEKLFANVFPAQLAHMRRAFAHFSQKELVEIGNSLSRLREAFADADGPGR